MNKFTSAIAITVLTAVSAFAQAADMTEEDAIAKALELHPGTFDKAYQETKKGVVLWEVKSTDESGQKWETFFKVEDGEFVMDEKVG